MLAPLPFPVPDRPGIVRVRSRRPRPVASSCHGVALRHDLVPLRLRPRRRVRRRREVGDPLDRPRGDRGRHHPRGAAATTSAPAAWPWPAAPATSAPAWCWPSSTPAVGTERRAVAVEVGDGMSVLVGPDNGLLAPAVAMVGGADPRRRAHQRRAPPGGSRATFAGRDMFAPAAAQLCTGVDLTELGELIDPAGLMPGVLPLSHLDDDGTLQRRGALGRPLRQLPAQRRPDRDRRLRRSAAPPGRRDVARPRAAVAAYREIGTGEVGLVVDSYGLLSVALDQRSAAAELAWPPAPPCSSSRSTTTRRRRCRSVCVSPVELRPRPDHLSGEQEMPTRNDA